MKRTATLSALALSVLLLGAAAPGGPVPLSEGDFATFPEAQVKAGQLLFYDAVLSGNRNISCGTCHHPRFATSDGQSLGVGEGGIGLGPERHADPKNLPERRIPRNSPALFNLGHKDIRVMFHDGRIEADSSRPNGFRTPLEDEMVEGFAGILSAQTMFPVLSPDEMAGHYQENEVSKAVRQGRITGEGGAWDLIAQRVDKLPAYREAFASFDPDIAGGAPIAFTDISDAIAAFIAVEWKATGSAYDIALRGGAPLPDDALRGQKLFFGAAGCGTCHNGPLFSDQKFHAMAEPQLGPGKAERFESHQRDEGRGRVSGRAEDAYAFRTPMLRNVVRTGPWGHAGAHTDLAGFLRYHADPVTGMDAYREGATLAKLPGMMPDWTIMEDAASRDAIKASFASTAVRLSDADIADLMAFLGALTDDGAIEGRLGIPEAVPSGLPVER